MSLAALVLWVLTAGGGLLMLSIWLRGGGLRHRHDGGTRFARMLVFGHAGFAAVGLLVWIAFVLDGSRAFAWIAAVLLVPVATLGLSMLTKWLGGRASARRDEEPEQSIPMAVVAAHGAAAIGTVVLVIVAAIVG